VNKRFPVFAEIIERKSHDANCLTADKSTCTLRISSLSKNSRDNRDLKKSNILNEKFAGFTLYPIAYSEFGSRYLELCVIVETF
jgi:hypothetical protein